MGCICAKASSAKDSIERNAKSALGMGGSRAVVFADPIKIFDCEKLQKGDGYKPDGGDNTFSCGDNRWSSVREGCIVDNKFAFVIKNDEFWKIDLTEKDYAKAATKLDSGNKYRDTKSMVHYDGKIYLFSDTIYKCDVGLGMLAKLPGLPGTGDSKTEVKTEAFAADDGIWSDTRCAIMIGKYAYCVCKSKLYRVDLSESDANKNTKLVSEESWGSAESMFVYDKKLYVVGSKIWEVQHENESAYPRAPWITFDEQHSYWSPSAWVVGDFAYVSGYNGLYQISMKAVASGVKRDVKHFPLSGKVVLNFI